MSKLDEAKKILSILGMGKTTVSTPYCLLALAGIKENESWASATNNWKTVRNQMDYMAEYYDKKYAENSRESIRKQSMHPMRTAALIEDNTDHEATNSSNYAYRITEEVLTVIKSFGTNDWDSKVQDYLDSHETLIEKYENKKKMALQPVKINGIDFTLSSGKHNELQKAIIEEFAPRFAPNSECLYIGDSTVRDLYKDEKKLAELGFEITKHDKMPDVVLYRDDVDWLYFIEAVTSGGPMNSKRILELKELTKNVTAGKIYVTAFLDFTKYKSFSSDLAWETEVWLAESPEHMIHLNGDRFMGPHNE